MAASCDDTESGISAFKRLEVFGGGDEFFAALQSSLLQAHATIDIEMYIFALDRIGEQVLQLLIQAVERGVRVRLIVDGVGSAPWARTILQRSRRAGIQCRIFHELPWASWIHGGEEVRRPQRWRKWFQRINSRNHRKICIVDSKTAFVGSMNITDYHLVSLVGQAAWRDTGVVVEGEAVRVIEESFEELWGGPLRRLRLRLHVKQMRRRRARRALGIRQNMFRRERRDNYLDLLLRISRARKKIWITNAYFVPDGSLLRALSAAAVGGIDVRIIVPGFSDVVFMPWIASAFHLGLLRAGVRIFEYRSSILHAKTMVVDSWGLVGSSNLNHRSLLHDLEIDVEVQTQEGRDALEQQFTKDLQDSVEVTLDTWRHRPWIERVVGRMLLAFRYLL
jgi:cardiolipin synthase